MRCYAPSAGPEGVHIRTDLLVSEFPVSISFFVILGGLTNQIRSNFFIPRNANGDGRNVFVVESSIRQIAVKAVLFAYKCDD